jgi:flavodoxin
LAQGLPNGFEGPAGLGQIFNKLASNPGFAAMLEKVKAHLSANPELAKMAEDLRTGGPASFINLAKQFKDKMEANADSAEGPRSVVDALKTMMGVGADVPGNEGVEQNVKDLVDQLPPTFKNKIASFGKQMEESEGDSFANALSLLGQHFDQDDLTNAAELLIPNIAQLIPNPAQAVAH